jgi:hypothetical protein
MPTERGSIVKVRKEFVMTATKAIAGGVAANIVTVTLWAVSNIPGWGAVPDEPKAAIIALVSAGVGAVIVYFAPANTPTLPVKTKAVAAAGIRQVSRGGLGALIPER